MKGGEKFHINRALLCGWLVILIFLSFNLLYAQSKTKKLPL